MKRFPLHDLYLQGQITALGNISGAQVFASGNMYSAEPTASGHLTTKKYVDDSIVGASGMSPGAVSGIAQGIVTGAFAIHTGTAQDDHLNYLLANGSRSAVRLDVTGNSTFGKALTVSGQVTAGSLSTTGFLIGGVAIANTVIVNNEVATYLHILGSGAVLNMGDAGTYGSSQVGIRLADTSLGAVGFRYSGSAAGNNNLYFQNTTGGTDPWTWWDGLASANFIISQGYLEVNGQATVTGNVLSIPLPTNTGHLTNKTYVDGISGAVSGIAVNYTDSRFTVHYTGDDHTHYLLANGSRSATRLDVTGNSLFAKNLVISGNLLVTGTISGQAGLTIASITTTGTVDGVDIATFYNDVSNSYPGALIAATVVLETATQSLYNKTLTGTSNIIAATHIHNTGGMISVTGGGTPAVGAVLTHTGNRIGKWVVPTPGGGALMPDGSVIAQKLHITGLIDELLLGITSYAGVGGQAADYFSIRDNVEINVFKITGNGTAELYGELYQNAGGAAGVKVVDLLNVTTLKNKTITGISNLISATHLFTTGGMISVSGGGLPPLGYVLTYTGNGIAQWQAGGGGVTSAQVTGIATGIASGMMGEHTGSADPHTVYLLANGSRSATRLDVTGNSLYGKNLTISGNLLVTGSISGHAGLTIASITTTGTVDGVDVSDLNTTLTSIVNTYPGAIVGSTIVLDTSTQSLYNKTITGVTNLISATHIFTTGGMISVSGGGIPSTGSVLVHTGNQIAVWQVPAGGITSAQVTGIATGIASGLMGSHIADADPHTVYILANGNRSATRLDVTGDSLFAKDLTISGYLEVGGAITGLGGLTIASITTTGTVDGVDVSALSTTVTSIINTYPSATVASTIVLDTATQSLYNKTITGVSNLISATHIFTTGGLIMVSGGGIPATSTVLTHTGNGIAIWQASAGGVTSAQVTGIATGIASGMMGEHTGLPDPHTVYLLANGNRSATRLDVTGDSLFAKDLTISGYLEVGGAITGLGGLTIASITTTGTVDGVDVSALSASYTTHVNPATDDHTLYLKADGSRSATRLDVTGDSLFAKNLIISGNLLVTGTISGHVGLTIASITTTGTVDGVDVSQFYADATTGVLTLYNKTITGLSNIVSATHIMNGSNMIMVSGTPAAPIGGVLTHTGGRVAQWIVPSPGGGALMPDGSVIAQKLIITGQIDETYLGITTNYVVAGGSESPFRILDALEAHLFKVSGNGNVYTYNQCYQNGGGNDGYLVADEANTVTFKNKTITGRTNIVSATHVFTTGGMIMVSGGGIPAVGNVLTHTGNGIAQWLSTVDGVDVGTFYSDVVNSYPGAAIGPTLVQETTTQTLTYKTIGGVILTGHSTTQAGCDSNGGNAGGGFYHFLFGYSNTSSYGHFLRTRHNGLAYEGNAFDFYTNNANETSSIGASVLGLTIENGGIRVPTSGNFASGVYVGHLIATGNVTATGLVLVSTTGIRTSPDVPTPAIGTARVYSQYLAGRGFVGVGDSYSGVYLGTPDLITDNIYTYQPFTGTLSSVAGMGITTAGTVSHPTMNTVVYASGQRFTQFASATTANAAGGLIGAHELVWRGTATGRGGFFFHTRFAVSTNTTGQQKCFVGLCQTGAVNIVTTPMTGWSNIIGMGYVATSTGTTGNYQLFTNDNAGNATVTDLGVNARKNATGVFDLFMYAPPGHTGIIVRIERPDQRILVLDDTMFSADIPQNTALLLPHAAAGLGGAGAGAQNFCLYRMYISSPT